GSTVCLRSAGDADVRMVFDLFAGLSERSLYYRFMAARHIDLDAARRIVASVPPGSPDRVHIVAERAGALCGIAGYYQSAQAPDRAEVAFAIADAFQGRGLGTRMLERLAEVGRDRGLRAFDAYVLGDNLAMMDVFLQSGFTLTQGLEQGVFHVALDLAPTAQFETASGRR